MITRGLAVASTTKAWLDTQEHKIAVFLKGYTNSAKFKIEIYTIVLKNKNNSKTKNQTIQQQNHKPQEKRIS